MGAGSWEAGSASQGASGASQRKVGGKHSSMLFWLRLGLNSDETAPEGKKMGLRGYGEMTGFGNSTVLEAWNPTPRDDGATAWDGESLNPAEPTPEDVLIIVVVA